MTLEEWKKSVKEQPRSYTHFDRRISLGKAWGYISVPNKVTRHGFYPFIRFTIKINKYNKKKRKKVTKEREVCYSAHKDRYIYQYYAYLLNEMYNERLNNDGLNNSVIAYRNNLKKNNNIYFAKRAFDMIRELGHCFVIIGDFTGFFDNLDHLYLKERMCDLLNLKMLPDDYYAVYRNITKFSTWKLTDLLAENGLSNTHHGRKEFNRLNTALPWDKFKSLKMASIKSHRETFGIPQGSSISAVLSNVYMLDFDAKINSHINSKKGLYMRYSDDLIIVLPYNNSGTLDEELELLMSIIDATPSLELEPNKTQLFEYNKGNIESFEVRDNSIDKLNKTSIDYLGFSFDGNTVSIRDKTVSKYYNKLNRGLKRFAAYKSDVKTKEIIKGIKLYRKFGCNMDRKNPKTRNFLTYVSKAEHIFGSTERVNLVKKRHIKKIRKTLKNS